MSPKSASRIEAERRGRRAERWTMLYLRLTGHSVIAKRFKVREGEIDLIARRGRTLIFIEVKQRSRADHAIDPVTAKSEDRIIRAGEVFLSRNPQFIDGHYALRYDVITVMGRWRIQHLKDAFRGW